MPCDSGRAACTLKCYLAPAARMVRAERATSTLNFKRQKQVVAKWS